MAKLGIEGIRRFGAARKAKETKDEDTSFTFTICNGFQHGLFKAGHRVVFYFSDDECWEIHLSDPSFGLGGSDFEWAELVDIFFICTHGTNKESRPVLQYNINKNQWSGYGIEWKLGHHNGLKWLMLCACDTIPLKDPGACWDIFRGLHEICGSYGTMCDSLGTAEIGEDVAQNLIDGDTVANAWFDGLSDWYCDQHAIVVAADSPDSYYKGELVWKRATINVDHLPPHGPSIADPSDKVGVSWLWVDKMFKPS